MLQNVAVVILNGFTPFELGVLCEVFGVNRTDDGLPAYDFAVVSGETASGAGNPPRSPRRRASPYPRPTAWTGCREADLVAVSAVGDGHLQTYTSSPVPGAADRRAAGHRGPRCPGAQRVQRRVRARRGRAAGRAALHHALAARPRPRAAASVGDRQPGGAVRGRGPGDHQRGHRGRHRRVPAPGPQGAGQPGGERDRPADGHPAASRRRPGPVRGPAGRRARLRHARRGHQLDAASPRRAGHDPPAGGPGPDVGAHLRPAVRAGDRHHAAALADRPAHPAGPGVAGGDDRDG